MESIYAANGPCMERKIHLSRKADAAKTCKSGMTEAHAEIQRDASGTIDFKFYHKKTKSLRSEKHVMVAKNIMRFFHKH